MKTKGSSSKKNAGTLCRGTQRKSPILEVDVKIERESDDTEMELYAHHVNIEDILVDPDMQTQDDLSVSSKDATEAGTPIIEILDDTANKGTQTEATEENDSVEMTLQMTPEVEKNENKRVTRKSKRDSSIRRSERVVVPKKVLETVKEPVKVKKQRKRSTSSELFNCKDCGKSFKKYYVLQKHIETHEKVKQHLYFKCDKCIYQTVTRDSLERHMKLHDTKRHYVCDVCGYRYTKKSNLMDHLKNVHLVKKSHVCSDCDYKTNDISVLNKHMRIHKDEKPHSCSLCQYRCNLKTDLTKHLRIHTGERPFSCSVCDFKCSIKSNLTKHLRIHTGEKPYCCSMCSYRSGRRDNYTTHMKSHFPK